MTAQTCTHRPPSPGQSLCQCRHQAIEAQYAVAIVERAGAERLARLRLLLHWAALCLAVGVPWAVIGYFLGWAAKQ